MIRPSVASSSASGPERLEAAPTPAVKRAGGATRIGSTA